MTSIITTHRATQPTQFNEETLRLRYPKLMSLITEHYGYPLTEITVDQQDIIVIFYFLAGQMKYSIAVRGELYDIYQHDGNGEATRITRLADNVTMEALSRITAEIFGATIPEVD